MSGHVALNPFLLDDVNIFATTTSTSMTAVVGTTTYTYLPIRTSYSGNKNAFYLQGGFASLTLGFNLKIAQFEVAAGTTDSTSQVFTINFTHSAGTIASLTITYSATNYLLSIASCTATAITLGSTAGSSSCLNTLNETVVATYSALKTTVGSGATIGTNPSTETVASVLDINVNIVYTPNLPTTTVFFNQLTPVNMALTSNLDRTAYISFNNFTYSALKCPTGCLLCSSATVCTTCANNYTLSSGLCTCSNTLENQFPVSSLITAYYNKNVCSVYGSTETAATTFIACADSIAKLILNEKITTNAYSTLNANQIQLEYVFSNSNSFSSLSTTCSSNIIVRFGLYLPTHADFQTLYYQLALDTAFGLTTKYTLTVPNFDYCASETYTDIQLQSTMCTIVTKFGYFNSAYTHSAASLTQQLIILKNTSTLATLKKIIIPLFTPSTEYSVKTTSRVTAIICRDKTCSLGAATRKFTQAQKLYVIINIQDPIYINYVPSVSTGLTINGDTRNALITSVTASNNNVVGQYLAVISLNSAELINNITLVLTLTYTTNGYSRVETVTFVIPMSTTTAEDKKFYQTLPFFVIIFTFGTIVVGAVIGLLFFGLAQLTGKHTSDEEVGGFGRDHESGKAAKYKNVELSAGQTNRFNKILDSLM